VRRSDFALRFVPQHRSGAAPHGGGDRARRFKASALAPQRRSKVVLAHNALRRRARRGGKLHIACTRCRGVPADARRVLCVARVVCGKRVFRIRQRRSRRTHVLCRRGSEMLELRGVRCPRGGARFAPRCICLRSVARLRRFTLALRRSECRASSSSALSRCSGNLLEIG
jgi:hypothetical protein